MNALFITIPLSLLLVLCFVKMFLWAVDNGQFNQAEKNKNIVFNNTEGNDYADRNQS